jgi:hypothetical protein
VTGLSRRLGGWDRQNCACTCYRLVSGSALDEQRAVVIGTTPTEGAILLTLQGQLKREAGRLADKAQGRGRKPG